MNILERKKINLLVHLAKIDGKFEKSEKALLKSFLHEKGITGINLEGEESLMISDFSQAWQN